MTTWPERFRKADGDPAEVVLEGVHAVKHALRFGAAVTDLLTPDRAELRRLTAELAPDLAHRIDSDAVEIPPDLFARLRRRPPGSPLLAVAAVPAPPAVLPAGRVVALFEPRHAGNTGAVIRVAAAAGAAGVLVTGGLDVWSPAVVRAAAGLHYALPVANTAWPLPGRDPAPSPAERDPAPSPPGRNAALSLLERDPALAPGERAAAPPPGRPVVAYDPDEGDADFRRVPGNAVLLFGGERSGLPRGVLDAADRVVRIPMRAGVSSLNLATSVAVALYAGPGSD